MLLVLEWFLSSHNHNVITRQSSPHLSLGLQPAPSRGCLLCLVYFCFSQILIQPPWVSSFFPQRGTWMPLRAGFYLCLRCPSTPGHLPIRWLSSQKTQLNHHLWEAFSDSVTLNSHFTPGRISRCSFWVPTKPYSYFPKLRDHIFQFWMTKVQYLLDTEEAQSTWINI